MATYPKLRQELRTIPNEHLSLEGLGPGRQARVQTIAGDGIASLALMEMGLRPGAVVRVIRHAPLGCPIEVAVGSARFAIRRDTARLVRLVPHG